MTRKVIVTEWMSLDGVVQSPSSADEDPSGGFAHGGWHPRYFDDDALEWTVDGVVGAGGYLLGRRTYEIFAAHWPAAGPEEQVLAEPLNARPKHVASRTLTGPLGWANSSLLGGDIAAAVAALTRQDGGDLLVIGSPGLVRTLAEHDLVDAYRLTIDPVVLGTGKRLFAGLGTPRPLRLVHSQVVTTGATLATYERA